MTDGTPAGMTPREAALYEALMDATVNLAAARSAYAKYVGRHDRKGARDPLYETRQADFAVAEDRARAVLVAYGSTAGRRNGRALTPGQQASRVAILAEVRTHGGETTWGRLRDRGHDLMQVKAAVRRGDLVETGPYAYALTDAGARILHGEGKVDDGRSRPDGGPTT